MQLNLQGIKALFRSIKYLIHMGISRRKNFCKIRPRKKNGRRDRFGPVASIAEHRTPLRYSGHGPNEEAWAAQEADGMTVKFFEGTRVVVSDNFFWAKGATATVGRPPEAIVALSGAWDDGLTRIERSALGENEVHFVYFDEPQLDADGDGPYRGGQIWTSALTLLAEIST